MTSDTARRHPAQVQAEEFTRKAWDGGHPSVTTAFLAGWDAAIEHAANVVIEMDRAFVTSEWGTVVRKLDARDAIRAERSDR